MSDTIVIPDISKVNITAGDLIVFKLLSDPSHAELMKMRQDIEHMIPGVRYCILTGGDSLEVLHEPAAIAHAMAYDAAASNGA